MQTATPVRTKSRTKRTNPVTATVIRQVCADLKSGKYTMRSAKTHGFHLLTAIGDEKTRYEWDVFGLILDRVADEWVLARKSGVHTATYYYAATMNGKGVTPSDLLPSKVIGKLGDLAYAGATPTQLADALMGMKDLILAA